MAAIDRGMQARVPSGAVTERGEIIVEGVVT